MSNWTENLKITEDMLKATSTREKERQPETLVKIKCWGFPGGAVVENLSANARDTGSSPGLGRSHMPQSNWARKPQLLSLRVWSLCSATREAAIVRGPRTAMKSGPRLPQLEKALAEKRRPNTAINKINKLIKKKKLRMYLTYLIKKKNTKCCLTLHIISLCTYLFWGPCGEVSLLEDRICIF